jgi:hypothetical protein
MPYAISRNPDGSYRVLNPVTGRVYARRMTKRRARAQVRLLRQKGGLT